MHLGKSHVVENPLRAIPQLLAHLLLQTEPSGFPLILRVWRSLEKISALNRLQGIDPQDTCSYIGSTYLAQFVGNHLETFHLGTVEVGISVPFTLR